MIKINNYSQSKIKNATGNMIDEMEIMEAMGDGFALLDMDGKILNVNTAFEKITGYSKSELTGKNTLEVVKKKVNTGNFNRLAKEIGLSIEGADANPEVFVITKKDGSKVFVSSTVSFVKIGSEKNDTIIFTLKDITNQKKLEQKLEKLMISELQRSFELKRSNEELEQFAYVASHDLKEPLRVIASYLQLIEKRYGDKLDDSGRDFISRAVNGAQRMQQMINDLLTYSRISTGKELLIKCNCEAVLNNVLENLKVDISRSNAIITHDLLPELTGDEAQLTRLFQNLINNAIKFCDKEKPVIHISAKKKNKKWLFSVKDNGIGIEPEYNDKIFKIFQHLHGRGKYPGNGIGLAVCKKIIEHHGGKIWVESKSGEGSVFCFTVLDTGKK